MNVSVVVRCARCVARYIHPVRDIELDWPTRNLIWNAVWDIGWRPAGRGVMVCPVCFRREREQLLLELNGGEKEVRCGGENREGPGGTGDGGDC